MTTPDTLPAANRKRAATLLLATLDNSPPEIVAILEEADREPGGLQGMMAALTVSTLDLLVGKAGVDGAREHLRLQILNAEMDSGD